tara:strand:+ start:113 stop:334 length:222 start_codon:yes stop_codon:yes gene_type:complete
MLKIIFLISLFSYSLAQRTCENSCGSGTLQEYWNDEVDNICTKDMNQDGLYNVLDIVTLANCVLEENCSLIMY